jgi:hypothetical protein
MNDSNRSLPSWLPIAGLLAGAVVVMLLLWFLVIKAEDDAVKDSPEVVQVSDLSDVAERVGHPVYWAGERAQTKLELSESDAGRVYVRYLDEDAEPGVRSTDFVTVATYPVEDAAAALRRGAKNRPGAELARSDDGALILIDPKAPGSVRIAHPGSDEQVELYTPNVRDSIRLATNGSIQPVP